MRKNDHQIRPFQCRLFASRAMLRAGFTYIELTVTIFLIGILTTISMGNFSNSLAEFRLNAAANRVVADLNNAREHAVSISATTQIHFRTVENNYTVYYVPSPDHPGQSYDVELLSDPSYQTEIDSVSLQGGDSAVFDNYGKPVPGGSLTLRMGTQTRTILLNAVTGRASIQ